MVDRTLIFIRNCSSIKLDLNEILSQDLGLKYNIPFKISKIFTASNNRGDIRVLIEDRLNLYNIKEIEEILKNTFNTNGIYFESIQSKYESEMGFITKPEELNKNEQFELLKKIKISEVFGPVAQGEGRYIGVPSIFVRTFGCNFRCPSFGLPKGQKTAEPQEISKNINQYSCFDELPLVKTGCDTYASVYPEFKQFSKDYSIDELSQKIISLLLLRSFHYGPGKDIHLVITGGEPLLGWQKTYIGLFEKLIGFGLKYVTFETNGTQKLSNALCDYLNSTELEVTFSVSPKLSVSGESWINAIKPESIRTYSNVKNSIIYTKFVVDKADDFIEVDEVVSELGSLNGVYIMPVGGCLEEYNVNAPKICNLTMERGYKFSPRLHVSLFGNTWGK